MERNINALIIKPIDSVAVTVTPLTKGDLAVYLVNGEEKQTPVMQNIPIYHKLSLIEIKKGDAVIKYGESIGTASRDIHIGEHVHTHNVTSNREQIRH
nr:UxaA family hydrolase [uncultured Bacillus sp.]